MPSAEAALFQLIRFARMFNKAEKGMRRRNMLQLTVLTLLVACDAPVLQELGEDEVVARSLGYKKDAKRVDRRAFSDFVTGQRCALCRLASPNAAGVLACGAFPGRSVRPEGWCARFEASTG